MIKRALIFAGVVLGVLAGFFLPDMLLHAADKENEKPVFDMASASEYEYVGTAEDRIRTLEAYENASPNIKRIAKSEAVSVDGLPTDLSGLLPEIGNGSVLCSEIILSPMDMNARFRFYEYIFSGEKGSIRMVVDAQNGMACSISLSNAAELLREWGKSDTDMHALARAYANLLGFDALSDLTEENSYGSNASTVKLDIKGERLGISVMLSAPAGVLCYRLICPAE